MRCKILIELDEVTWTKMWSKRITCTLRACARLYFQLLANLSSCKRIVHVAGWRLYGIIQHDGIAILFFRTGYELCHTILRDLSSHRKWCNMDRRHNSSTHTTALQWRHNEYDGVSNCHPTIVYSTVYSGANQRKHQSSASLAFVRGIHRWLVNFPHKGSVTRKMFPFGDVIMQQYVPQGR